MGRDESYKNYSKVKSTPKNYFEHSKYYIQTIPERILKIISIVGFFVLWWGLVRFQILGFELLPTPIETITAIYGHIIIGEPMANNLTIYEHTYHTIYRVGTAMFLALITAIPIGLAIGQSELLQSYIYPSFELLRPIPPVAWVPLSIVIFATDFIAVIWVVFVGAFFPILINTIEGAKRVEKEYIRAVKSLGGDKIDVIRHVVIPSALSSIFTGAVIGMGLGWIAVVAAEMLVGNTGLGYTTFQSYRMLETDTVIVAIITLGVFGSMSSAIISRTGDRLTPWRTN